MKLIIDINEDIYNHMKERYMYGYTNTEIDKVGLAVKNGTPLDNLRADLESLREPTEPHLVDFRYHRNDMLDMVLSVIERYRNEVSN